MACCAHDHDCGSLECSKMWSLHEAVDGPRVSCLNASGDHPSSLFREWELRTDGLVRVQSDEGDPEVLLHVPFDRDVRCTAMCIVGGPGCSGPSSARIFVNRSDMDFEMAEQLPPQQEIELVDDHDRGVMEYALRPAKFGCVRSLTLHLPTNLCGEGPNVIQFVGFKGIILSTAREPPKSIVYEAKPNVKDHRTAAEDGASSTIF